MARRKRKIRKQPINLGEMPERSRFKAKHRAKGKKVDFRGQMASDERQSYYPERAARRHSRHPDPLVSRGDYATGEARRQGFFKVIGRAGGSTLDYYGKRIRARVAERDVSPLPDGKKPFSHATDRRRDR